MNLNDLAVDICKAEAGKKEVNIAQVKEILSIVLKKLNNFSDGDILKTIHDHK